MSSRSLCIWIAAALCGTICALAPIGVASAEPLPDSRVYELVTPPDGFGSEVYQPADRSIQQSAPVEFSSAWTEYPFESSTNGDAVAFVAGPTVGGSESSGWHGGNEYVARRTEAGQWTVSNASPTDADTAVYQAFSPDLSLGVLEATQPLAPTAPGFGEAPSEGEEYNYDVLYSTELGSGGNYKPLYTTKPPYRSPREFETHMPAAYEYLGAVNKPETNSTFVHLSIWGVTLMGASSDWSHLLFMANDALTGASDDRPAAEGGSSKAYYEMDNLYDSVNGETQLVNILPDGTTHANAIFGGRGPAYSLRPHYSGLGRFSHVISSDGSKVFWTDLNTDHIYVREDGLSTVEISPAGQYQTASSNGSTVLYTNGDLYEYELASGKTVDLTPGAPVEEVVGTSEDASYIYYVTSAGEFKLWHDGASTTISSSAPAVTEVTPDGRNVVYITRNETRTARPVMVYDAETGHTSCASCTSGGSLGVLPTTNQDNIRQTRWISADGSKVFFVSYEALVPQDTNDRADIYEWERAGSGSCEEAEGCVYLLSGGTSVDESYFAEMDETGNNVFVVTRAKLTQSDDNELYDLYDLRVNGHVAIAPPACSGTGCQGVPGSPPIFATPSSVTFEGVGNFAPVKQESSGKAKVKPTKHKSKKHRAKDKARRRAKKSNHGADRPGHSRTRGR